MHFNAWVWSTPLKHVAYIDETKRTLLWLAAVHTSELLYPFVCIHNSELLNRFWRITWKIVELVRFLFRSDSCSSQCAWNLHVQMNVCIPVLHICGSFPALCLWTNSVRIRATEREWAYYKTDESLNAVVMKQQDTTFTQMTNEIAITAIFPGLGYTLGHWGTGGLICCGRKSFVSSPKCPDQIWGPFHGY